MTAVNEFQCDRCLKKVPAHWNGEFWLPPKDWLDLRDNHQVKTVGHLCATCNPLFSPDDPCEDGDDDTPAGEPVRKEKVFMPSSGDHSFIANQYRFRVMELQRLIKAAQYVARWKTPGVEALSKAIARAFSEGTT